MRLCKLSVTTLPCHSRACVIRFYHNGSAGEVWKLLHKTRYGVCAVQIPVCFSIHVPPIPKVSQLPKNRFLHRTKVAIPSFFSRWVCFFGLRRVQYTICLRESYPCLKTITTISYEYRAELGIKERSRCVSPGVAVAVVIPPWKGRLWFDACYCFDFDPHEGDHRKYLDFPQGYASSSDASPR